MRRAFQPSARETIEQAEDRVFGKDRQMSDGALEFLKRAASENCRVVCSGDLTRFQIVEAQGSAMFYVEPGGGLGWALLPWDLTTDKDRLRERELFRDRLRDRMDQPPDTLPPEMARAMLSSPRDLSAADAVRLADEFERLHRERDTLDTCLANANAEIERVATLVGYAGAKPGGLRDAVAAALGK